MVLSEHETCDSCPEAVGASASRRTGTAELKATRQLILKRTCGIVHHVMDKWLHYTTHPRTVTVEVCSFTLKENVSRVIN